MQKKEQQSSVSSMSVFRVTNVKVEGNNRIGAAYFDRVLSHCKISSEDGFVSFSGLNQELNEVNKRLASSGLFKDDDGINIDIVAPNVLNEAGDIIGQDNKSLTIILKVKEKGVPFISAGTYTEPGKNSNTVGVIPGVPAHAMFEGGLRSPFGIGEQFKFKLSTSKWGSGVFNFSAIFPYFTKQNHTLNIRADVTQDDNTFHQSISNNLTSISADLSSEDGKHTWSTGIAIRDDIPRSSQSQPLPNKQTPRPAWSQKDTSGGIMSVLGSSSKCHVKYTGRLHDTRDNMASPSTGQYVQTEIELAMSPGTAQFIKAQVSTQSHHCIGPPLFGQTGAVASFMGDFGFIMPLTVIHPYNPIPTMVANIPSISTIYAYSLGSIFSMFYNDKSTFVEPNISPRSVAGPSWTQHNARRIPLVDRFYLGGPGGTSVSMRGFDVMGVGQRSSYGREHHAIATRVTEALPPSEVQNLPIGDVLGGCSTASFTSILSVPLPFMKKETEGIRPFVFYSAGMLGDPSYWVDALNRQEANVDNDNIFGPLRMSIGGGISMSMAGGIGRLEATYSLPLVKGNYDVSKGFQLGVGVTIN